MKHFCSKHIVPILPLMIAVVVPAIISVLILWDANLELCVWQRECWDFFVSYFDVPIKFLAAGISLASLYYLIVRTRNAIVAFERQTIQNAFSNYFIHNEKFIEFIKKKIATINFLAVESVDFKQLYFFFYPNAQKGSFELSKDVEKEILRVKKYQDNQHQNYGSGSNEFDYPKHCSFVSQLSENLGIAYDGESSNHGDTFHVEQAMYCLINACNQFWWNDSKLILNTDQLAYMRFRG